MKLNKEKLAIAAREGIRRAQASQIEWDKNVDAAEKAWEQRWKDEQIPKWRTFRDELTKILKSGGPVTQDMLPITLDRYDEGKSRGFYRPFNRGKILHSHRQWAADHEFGQRPVLKVAAFETLIDFLDAVDEDFVTTTQLERAGFRNMSKLFEAAANGYWD